MPAAGTAAGTVAGTAAGYGDALASDADRERVIDLLKEAFAEGRLTRQQHGARVQRAFGSRTYGELDTVSADLPAGPLRTLPSWSGTVTPAASAYLAAAPSRRTSPLAVACLVCGLIPVLPATLSAIILGIAARRQIARTGERGAGLATAGLALGALWIVLTLIALTIL
jgi:Domain of unknown function (DUF1707)/Domain of unknown function (DUF4190)